VVEHGIVNSCVISSRALAEIRRVVRRRLVVFMNGPFRRFERAT
jgi:hypothetical protein